MSLTKGHVLRVVLNRLKKPLSELTLFEITDALETYAEEKWDTGWLDMLSELDLYTTGDVLMALYEMGYDEGDLLPVMRRRAHGE